MNDQIWSVLFHLDAETVIERLSSEDCVRIQSNNFLWSELKYMYNSNMWKHWILDISKYRTSIPGNKTQIKKNRLKHPKISQWVFVMNCPVFSLLQCMYEGTARVQSFISTPLLSFIHLSQIMQPSPSSPILFSTVATGIDQTCCLKWKRLSVPGLWSQPDPLISACHPSVSSC